MSALESLGRIGDTTEAVVIVHKQWLVVAYANLGATTHVVEVYTQSVASRAVGLAHKYEVETPCKVNCSTITNSYIVFGTVAGEVCFHSLLSGEIVSTHPSPKLNDAVVAMALSHPSHTNIVVAHASCRIVMYHGHNPHHAVVLCGVGVISNIIASSLPVLPSVVSVLERTGEEGTTIVTTGAPFLSCFQNVRPPKGSGAGTNLMAVTNVIATSAVSMARRLWGGGHVDPQAIRPPPATSTVIETSQVNQFCSLSDAGRFGDCVVPDPSYHFAAVSDKLGRVTLLDLRMFVVVDVLKGYREVSLGWTSSTAMRRHGHALVVYQPWRGVLEVFALEGLRLVKRHAEEVGKNARVLVNGLVVRSGGEVLAPILDDNFEKKCGAAMDRQALCAAAYEHTTSQNMSLETFTSLCGTVLVADPLDRFEFCEAIFSAPRCDVFTQVLPVLTIVTIFFDYIRGNNALWDSHVEPHIPCLTDFFSQLPAEDIEPLIERLCVCEGEAAAVTACVLRRCGVSPPDGLIQRAMATTPQFICDRYMPLGLEAMCPRRSLEYAYYRLLAQCHRKERIKTDTPTNCKPFFRHAIICNLWAYRHERSVINVLRTLLSEYQKVTTDPRSDFCMSLLLDDPTFRATVAHALTFQSGPKSLRKLDMYMRISDLVCASENGLVNAMDLAFSPEVVHAFDIAFDPTLAPEHDLDSLRKARKEVVALAANVGAVSTVHEVLDLSGMLELDNADCAFEFLLRGYLQKNAELDRGRVEEFTAKMSDKRVAADIIAETVRVRIRQYLAERDQMISTLTGKKKALATQHQADLAATMSVEFSDWVFSAEEVKACPSAAGVIDVIAGLIPLSLRHCAETKTRTLLLEAAEFLKMCAKLENIK